MVLVGRVAINQWFVTSRGKAQGVASAVFAAGLLGMDHEQQPKEKGPKGFRGKVESFPGFVGHRSTTKSQAFFPPSTPGALITMVGSRPTSTLL